MRPPTGSPQHISARRHDSQTNPTARRMFSKMSKSMKLIQTSYLVNRSRKPKMAAASPKCTHLDSACRHDCRTIPMASQARHVFSGTSKSKIQTTHMLSGVKQKQRIQDSFYTLVHEVRGLYSSLICSSPKTCPVVELSNYHVYHLSSVYFRFVGRHPAFSTSAYQVRSSFQLFYLT